jgi:phosphate transport system protein
LEPAAWIRHPAFTQGSRGRDTLAPFAPGEANVKRTIDPMLDTLRETCLRMGSLCEAILAKSMRAVWQRDAETAGEVRRDDLEIDRLDVRIDEEVTQILALQHPLANDLRRVLAVRSMATDLERVGDLARNIAKSAARLAARPPLDIPPRLAELEDQATRALRAALDAFTESDAARARQVMAWDDAIDESEDIFIREAIEAAGTRPENTPQEVDLILIAKSLERVADHATNIAEEVVFLAEARIVRHEAKLAGS